MSVFSLLFVYFLCSYVFSLFVEVLPFAEVRMLVSVFLFVEEKQSITTGHGLSFFPGAQANGRFGAKHFDKSTRLLAGFT